jgi:putative oxidoreductase
MLGGILIFHGIHKALYGVDEISVMLTSFGLPAFLSYGVYIGELIAPAMIRLGVLTRPAAFLS